MKKIIWIFAATVVFLGAFFVFRGRDSQLQYSPNGNILETIKINGKTIEAEVVFSPEKVALGLSGRESMCENCGMLFVFADGDYRSFWMKDMNFNLDMLWIMGDKVVYIAKNVSHEKGTGEVVAPGIKAEEILELNSGTSDRLGIKVGNKIEL